jgi:SAM-dependent methyltransferase
VTADDGMASTYFNEHQKAHKTVALIEVLTTLMPKPPQSILVVGCGSGHEAGLLARAFNADTIGTDVGGQFTFDDAAAAPATLLKMDAQELAFPDNTFDLVFSFHALEHIAHPDRALAEMARVLRIGGSYLIGTPNKLRLIGYVGAPCPLRRKVLYNFHDYIMRLSGRWSNDDGAHAGFTAPELLRMCQLAFGDANDISHQYYLRLYRSKTKTVNAIVRAGIQRRVFPCVYVIGLKSRDDASG